MQLILSLKLSLLETFHTKLQITLSSRCQEEHRVKPPSPTSSSEDVQTTNLYSRPSTDHWSRYSSFSGYQKHCFLYKLPCISLIGCHTTKRRWTYLIGDNRDAIDDYDPLERRENHFNNYFNMSQDFNRKERMNKISHSSGSAGGKSLGITSGHPAGLCTLLRRSIQQQYFNVDWRAIMQWGS